MLESLIKCKNIIKQSVTIDALEGILGILAKLVKGCGNSKYVRDMVIQSFLNRVEFW